ncbi:MAG: hypothetical protein B5766_03995 [Candidatus Lumbricidophila eiseniae]|uniref:DUF11 domain-containing protein n=1 Tax=Candidatus Lumbricidiphila eiseniae TaxID=1969409 RepID=A0A2A6FSH1_9MICO|nr:MAG: hypothetical protein B5766_03995 [Candidatus Lumbricidophila eiseniae]
MSQETVTKTIRVVPVHPSLSLATKTTAGNKTVGDTISYTFNVISTGDVVLRDIPYRGNIDRGIGFGADKYRVPRR